MRRRRDTVWEDPFRPPISPRRGQRMGPWPHGSRSFSCLLFPLLIFRPCTETGRGRERRPGGAARTARAECFAVARLRRPEVSGRVRRLLWAGQRRADADRAEGVGAVGVEGRMEVEQGRFLFSWSTCVSVSSRASSGQGVHLVLNFSCSEGGCLLWAVARTVFTLNMERNVMKTWVELDVG